MKVAIVHDFLIKLGGAEKVLQVLHQIYPDAPIYTLLYDKEGTKGVFEKNGYKIISSSLQNLPSLIRRRSKLLLPYFPRAIEEFDLSQFEVVISSSNSFAHGVITRPSCLHLCYCYSPTRYLWDWHHHYLKENNLDRGFVGRKVSHILSRIRLWDFCAASRVDHWVAISQTVAARLRKYYRVDSSIIYPPTDINKIRAVANPSADYFLIVSRLSPYKNVDLAVKAFNHSGQKLLIVGEGSDRSRLQGMAKSNIFFLGYKSDREVKSLMQNCRALIFPGEEDFGLTPIEAMASGRPVIAYNRGGVSESVISGRTGIFFNENTSDSLVSALNEFENSYNNFQPEICRQRAAEFSQEKFIEQIKKTVINSYSILNIKK